jgi:Na+/melibiose symporter-like transporter
MAGGAFLTSLVLAQFGFVSDGDVEQSESALFGIRIAYSALPFVLWLCAFLLLRRYNLTEAKFKEIKDQIQQRVAEQPLANR